MVFGRVDRAGLEVPVGVRNSREGLEIRIGGERADSAASLAEVLPLQVIDPDVHSLVAGGPDGRRRYLDWIAFHVEHGYLEAWRRFRRALKQRNAALKNSTSLEALAGWDRELAETGSAVHDARLRVLELLAPAVQGFGADLLAEEVDVDYQQGWASDLSLSEALAANHERDTQLGSTQSGPHRGDLKLIYDERQARRLVSRGQQKLLACALILAATELVQTHLERRLLLLLDDPAAELDRRSLGRLMSAVVDLDTQVVATSLEPEAALFPEPPRLFHVEHGQVRAAN